MPYGIDDKMIRAERTQREYDEAVKLLEVYREEARKAIDALHPSPPQRGFLLSFYVGWVHDERMLYQPAYL